MTGRTMTYDDWKLATPPEYENRDGEDRDCDDSERYLIRYHTASHRDWDGPFDTLDEAREAMAEDRDWYIARLACIVQADPTFPDDIKRAAAIECASDVGEVP